MEEFELPADFDFDQEVINFQFGMMLQIRNGYEKRFQFEQNRLRSYLRKHSLTHNQIDKVMKKVQLTAYHTIPKEFWKNIKIKTLE